MKNIPDLRVVALSGGVGGAKLAEGLQRVLEPGNLTVIVNTGDDWQHLGLNICPDLDSVCYALAGIADPVKGWGIVDESWRVMDALGRLGAENWFRLGDKDLATHLQRTQYLAEGKSLTEATNCLCKAWSIPSKVLPMSDNPAPTTIISSDGEQMAFQEYFVHQQWQPVVKAIKIHSLGSVHTTPACLQALAEADLVVFCPSNPWVSMAPILSMDDFAQALRQKPAVAVSPIVGGKALKGPAAKMFSELGLPTTSASVLALWRPWLKAFVYDDSDHEEMADLEEDRILLGYCNTIMQSSEDKTRLAEYVLTLGVQAMENT